MTASVIALVLSVVALGASIYDLVLARKALRIAEANARS